MINTATIKAGQIATILLQGELSMNKGGRKGIAINPFLGRVTRNHRFTITIAGEETYTNIQTRKGNEIAGKEPWFRFIKDGLVVHKQTNQLYIAGIPTSNVGKIEYLLDGRPMTEEELETLYKYKPASEPAEFLTIAIENVVNVEG
jgi:hypothetical protein